MNKNTITWAAAFGTIAVILGAMGAHALEGKLEPSSIDSFETAVRYQMWHALALVAMGLYSGTFKFQKAVKFCWITGIILFSGSIYVLSTKDITGWEISFIGPITPIGGLFFIAGWLLLLSSSFTRSTLEQNT